MKKVVETGYASDKDVAYLEEIRDIMDIISTRAIWLMGVMVLIVLAIVSFLAKDFGSEVYLDGFSLLIVITARTLCLLYSLTLLIYIPLLIIPKFGDIIHEKYTPEEIQKNKERNAENLEKLKLHFKTLIGLCIFFPSASFIVIGAGYVVL